jgi:hypothetical protein
LQMLGKVRISCFIGLYKPFEERVGGNGASAGRLFRRLRLIDCLSRRRVAQL